VFCLKVSNCLNKKYLTISSIHFKEKELNLIFQNLNIDEDMIKQQLQQPVPPLKIINNPWLFSGNKRELNGFLERIKLTINAHPQGFINDTTRV